MTQKTIETTMAGWKGLFLLLPGAHSTVPTAPSASTTVNKQVQTNNHKMKDSPERQTTRGSYRNSVTNRARPPNPPAPYSTLHPSRPSLPHNHSEQSVECNAHPPSKVQLRRKVQKSPGICKSNVGYLLISPTETPSNTLPSATPGSQPLLCPTFQRSVRTLHLFHVQLEQVPRDSNLLERRF